LTRVRPCMPRCCAAGLLFARQLAEEAMAYPRRLTSISDLARSLEGNVHRPTRRWWTPWRSGCVCGLDEWPCEFAQGLRQLASPGVSCADRAEVCRAFPPSQDWNGPTGLDVVGSATALHYCGAPLVDGFRIMERSRDPSVEKHLMSCDVSPAVLVTPVSRSTMCDHYDPLRGLFSRRSRSICAE
jgi:hypothetical protein